ncbi:uncharacterized protein RBU33_027262 isoform 2-T4 [Hipposideros larvatus]
MCLMGKMGTGKSPTLVMLKGIYKGVTTREAGVTWGYLGGWLSHQGVKVAEGHLYLRSQVPFMKKELGFDEAYNPASFGTHLLQILKKYDMASDLPSWLELKEWGDLYMNQNC